MFVSECVKTHHEKNRLHANKRVYIEVTKRETEPNTCKNGNSCCKYVNTSKNGLCFFDADDMGELNPKSHHNQSQYNKKASQKKQIKKQFRQSFDEDEENNYIPQKTFRTNSHI
eukprot:TRINITY_DN441_c0_g1_i1.p1 TRINITY_DN441_c0_g1~~TRINITY_DN441_c0_g1_i1.p1  ORF type:complete len:114 (+),score=31.47 TRINITY_DN441_c0_g1_i1:472-813(+)